MTERAGVENAKNVSNSAKGASGITAPSSTNKTNSVSIANLEPLLNVSLLKLLGRLATRATFIATQDPRLDRFVPIRVITMPPNFIQYDYLNFPPDEQLRRAREFSELCNRRRTVRHFSSKPVSRELLETLIRTAGTAPSGANKQPWRFIIVTDAALKRKIRIAAEKEEKQNYERRMSQEWLDDLAFLGTDWHKEFLEVAPALIAVFSVEYEKEGERIRKNYYVKESVGLAVGFLIVAIHNAGLVSLTHTPSPMHFLQKILNRPSNERPFVLIPVGYPAENVTVPNIQRKQLAQISVWL